MGRDGAAPTVAAVVLAAGRSRRMGGRNKLLAPVGGVPMLRLVVQTALTSRADPVIVVTGHDGAAVAAALAELPVRCVHNAAFADGLSRSLAVGLAAVPPGAAGALICLGDMPRVPVGVLDALIGAFEPAAGRAICVPMQGAKRGNPVLWGRRYFPAMQALSGDTGARGLLRAHADQVWPVPVDDDGVLRDVDTPADLAVLTRA